MALVRISRWEGLRYSGVSIVDSSSTLVSATYFAEGGFRTILETYRLVIAYARVRTRTATIPRKWSQEENKERTARTPTEVSETHLFVDDTTKAVSIVFWKLGEPFRLHLLDRQGEAPTDGMSNHNHQDHQRTYITVEDIK